MFDSYKLGTLTRSKAHLEGAFGASFPLMQFVGSAFGLEIYCKMYTVH